MPCVFRRAGNLAGFSARQNPPRTNYSTVGRMGTPESCRRPDFPPPGEPPALTASSRFSKCHSRPAGARKLQPQARGGAHSAARTWHRALSPQKFGGGSPIHKISELILQQISAVGAQHSQRTKKKPPLSQAEPPSKMLGPSGEFVELRVSGVPRLRSDAPERPHTGTSCPSTSCGRA